MALNVYEIFYSIEGESTTAGFTSLFIRLAGCNLNCSWCDTVQARTAGGTLMSISDIVFAAGRYEPFHHITLTGGEPLLQGEAFALLKELAGAGYDIQVETNGSIFFGGLPENVRIIADVKTPSSGEENSFNMENLKLLRRQDEVKFVINVMEDYEFARQFIRANLAGVESVINLSPVKGFTESWVLANLIVKDRLPVRLNVQLHKIAGFK